VNADCRRHRVALFAGSVAVLLPGAFWGLPSGKSVAGALVILDGGVPYRDFWSMYAPGQFYAVAALYRVFGSELLVQGIATVLAVSASAVALAALMHRLGASCGLGAMLGALFTLMSWTTAPELSDYPLALPFLLLALERSVRYVDGGGARHLRWSGAWLGVAACFKHDVAAYFALGTAIALVLSWRGARGARPAGWISPWRATMITAAFAVAAAAPLAAWTAVSAGPDAWNDLFVFPATVFRKVRNEPFPPLIPDFAPIAAWLADPLHIRRALRASDGVATWIVLYAPVLVLLTGVGVLVWNRRTLEGRTKAVLILLLACMPFFLAAVQVQHNTHPYTLAILSAGVGVVLWRNAAGRHAGRAGLRIALSAAAGIYAVGLTTPAIVAVAAVYYEWEGSRVLDLPGVRGVRLPARTYDSLFPVGRFFRTHTREDEPIYTGLVRHDAIVINNTMLYPLAGRPACCGYTELHPGVADRASVQERIVRRLEDGRVRAIALWEFGWAPEVMEARKRRAMAAVPDAGSTILDRYISEHYRVLESHGEYRVLWRRDEPWPSAGPTGGER